MAVLYTGVAALMRFVYDYRFFLQIHQIADPRSVRPGPANAKQQQVKAQP